MSSEHSAHELSPQPAITETSAVVKPAKADTAATGPTVAEPIIVAQASEQLTTTEMTPTQPTDGKQTVDGKSSLHKPELLKSPFWQQKLDWGLAFIAAIFLAITITYSLLVSSTTGQLGLFRPTVSNATILTRVLSILSEGVTLLLAALIPASASIVMWAAGSNRRGITVATWLAMSPSTGLKGFWKLMWWKRKRNSLDLHRPWIFIRFYNSRASAYGEGFITTTPVYERLFTFPVSAGIGPYNVSLAQSNFYFPSQIAITVATLFSTLFADITNTLPLTSTHCPSDSCLSYFFPGSMGLIAPWPWRIQNFSRADVLIVHGVQGVQVDFWSKSVSDQLESNDCKLWGGDDVAIMICIAVSSLNHSNLVAGVSFCPADVGQQLQCQRNNSWTNQYLWSTSMAVSQRTADIVYSRSNSSILSASKLSIPLSEAIIPSDLFDGLDKFFSTDNSSVQNPNSTTVVFLTFLSSYFQVASETTTGVMATSYLQALLVLPLLLFQASWFNPDLHPSPDYPATGLPTALYVSADLAKSGVRASIPRWSAILYAVTCLMAYFWCVGGMCIAMFVQTPPTTPFEMIDFASRIVSTPRKHSLSDLLAQTSIGKADLVREKLEEKALFVRDVGFSGDTDEVGHESGSDRVDNGCGNDKARKDCESAIRNRSGKVGFLLKNTEGGRLNRDDYYE